MNKRFNAEFWRGKRVFLTGHTGFKGSWLSYILAQAGAVVTGYALEPPTQPNLFNIAHIADNQAVTSIIGDIRDFKHVQRAMEQANPEIVFHLAAQPIVLSGYEEPRYTYETNVMGTVNVLESVRACSQCKSVVNVTTDKVYYNAERENYGYKETDPLDGYDPYSNSKSCSELVTHSYAKSFLTAQGIAVSTARAGNVVGGGDFSPNRIVPDCVRAVETGKALVVRNPFSTRPYQHVLDPLFAYLCIAQGQWEQPDLAGSYNVGPDDCDCVNTGNLVQLFADAWGSGFSWKNAAKDKNAPHEANFLKLDNSKIKEVLNWEPRWHIAQAIQTTAEWSRAYLDKKDVCAVMDRQIKEFLSK